MSNKTKDCCPMCDFEYQACNAIVEVAKKYGLVVKGSVISDSNGIYKIRFAAAPVRKLKA
ncbi:MAG: hypothetical protein AB1351_00235 [Thermoproteota archaeon]